MLIEELLGKRVNVFFVEEDGRTHDYCGTVKKVQNSLIYLGKVTMYRQSEISVKDMVVNTSSLGFRNLRIL